MVFYHLVYLVVFFIVFWPLPSLIICKPPIILSFYKENLCCFCHAAGGTKNPRWPCASFTGWDFLGYSGDSKTHCRAGKCWLTFRSPSSLAPVPSVPGRRALTPAGPWTPPWVSGSLNAVGTKWHHDHGRLWGFSSFQDLSLVCSHYLLVCNF